MEEPVDVHSRHGGRKKGYAKTCNASVSVSIDEDICLDKYKLVTDTRGSGTYNLKVPVNDM